MTRTNDPFNELRFQLEHAHAREALPAEEQRHRRPTRRWSRIGLLVTSAALVTGTAVAATTPWSLDVGGDHGAKAPTQANVDLPPAQTATLSVLRRQQSDQDRNPAVLRALRTVSSHLGAGLHIDGIRLLREHSQDSVVLLPLERVGPSEDPAHQINDGLCVYTAYKVSTGGSSDAPTAGGVPTPTAISGASCGSLQDLKRGRITGLVPDGVARVRVTLENGKVVTADVTDNYYEPSGATNDRSTSANPEDTTWLDADGRVITKAAG